MRKLIITLGIGFFLGVFLSTCGGWAEESLPQLLLDRQAVFLSGCLPGNTYEEKVHLVLRSTSSRWAVLVSTEAPKKNEEVLQCFSLEGPWGTVKGLEEGTHKLMEGSALREDTVVEVKLLFEPNWRIPPDTYQFLLLFQHVTKDGEPGEPPLPLEVKVEVREKVFLEAERKGSLNLVVQGPPGLYPLEGSVVIHGKSNTAPWKILLSTKGLRGEKGGLIPPARIFRKVKDTYISLEKGLEFGPFDRGEVEIVLDNLYVQTVFSDQPDTYQGELCLLSLVRE